MSNAANDDEAGLFRLFGEDDIHAYAQGGLDPERRRQIEGYLACNPDLAARVMRSLHSRAPQPSRPAARTRPMLLLATGLAACGLSAWAGSSLDGDAPPPSAWRERDGDRAPAYVDEAAMSRRVYLVREAMQSQAETPNLDAGEISRELHLRLPTIPTTWRLLDVQVVPSDDGPGVSVAAATPEGERMTLFAVRANHDGVDEPVLASRGKEEAAYWEADGMAFVLSGEGEASALLDAAKMLAAS